MAVRTYSAEVSQDVKWTVCCDQCGERFDIHRRLTANAGSVPMFSHGSADGAHSAASHGLQSLIKQRGREVGEATIGALCPHCKRFRKVSMTRHFPNGLREGLLQKLQRSRMEAFCAYVGGFFGYALGAMLLGLAGLAAFGVCGVLGVPKPDDSQVVVVVVFGSVAAVMGLALLCLGYFSYNSGSRSRAYCQLILSRLSDNEIMSFVEHCYHKSGDYFSLPCLNAFEIASAEFLRREVGLQNKPIGMNHILDHIFGFRFNRYRRYLSEFCNEVCPDKIRTN